jgi:hypothetical protein
VTKREVNFIVFTTHWGDGPSARKQMLGDVARTAPSDGFLCAEITTGRVSLYAIAKL